MAANNETGILQPWLEVSEICKKDKYRLMDILKNLSTGQYFKTDQVIKNVHAQLLGKNSSRKDSLDLYNSTFSRQNRVFNTEGYI